MKSLNNIKPNKKSQFTFKRLGRGNASGKGTYSGKGLKGQSCRSGVSNLKRIGLKSTLFSTPKKRGFNRVNKTKVVYTSQLNECFKDGDRIDGDSLRKAGLVVGAKSIKIILNGELKLKGLKVCGVKVSGSVAELVGFVSGNKEAVKK